MQTTGIFTKYRYEIPIEKYGEPIYLIPFGDVHRSSPLCDVERWLEFLDWAKGKPRCYFLGMGDYDDMSSASERHILSNRALHEATHKTLEDLYLKHTTRFAKEIKMMGGKLIGLLEGNHYGELASTATTTTQKLAELMGCQYLGVSSFIRLSFQGKRHGSRSCVDIWAHHGKGAGRLIGSSLNRVEQMLEAAECDIALMGHDHKKSVGTKTRFRLTTGGGGELHIKHRKILVARTGSFLKGYEDGHPSYIADGAMSPTDLGVVKIELTPRSDRRGNVNIDIHASI